MGTLTKKSVPLERFTTSDATAGWLYRMPTLLVLSHPTLVPLYRFTTALRLPVFCNCWTRKETESMFCSAAQSLPLKHLKKPFLCVAAPPLVTHPAEPPVFSSSRWCSKTPVPSQSLAGHVRALVVTNSGSPSRLEASSPRQTPSEVQTSFVPCTRDKKKHTRGMKASRRRGADTMVVGLRSAKKCLHRANIILNDPLIYFGFA